MDRLDREGEIGSRGDVEQERAFAGRLVHEIRRRWRHVLSRMRATIAGGA